MRIIAYKDEKMSSIYEIVEERDCDPRPGKFSLWHIGNGSWHPELRGYEKKYTLATDAWEEFGFRVARIFPRIDGTLVRPK